MARSALWNRPDTETGTVKPCWSYSIQTALSWSVRLHSDYTHRNAIDDIKQRDNSDNG